MVTPLAHIERAARVKVMIFDVDGVLTDGSLTYGPDGEATKTFNVLDGLGIQLLQQTGVQTAIISARKSPIVVRRAADLGITHVYQGHARQARRLRRAARADRRDGRAVRLHRRRRDRPAAAAQVGFAVTRAERPSGSAAPRPLRDAEPRGGRGAVREVCDMVMRAQGTYEQALAPYFA